MATTDGVPSIPKALLNWRSLAIRDMQQEHDDDQDHHNSYRDVPVRAQPYSDVLECLETNQVQEVVKCFLIINDYAAVFFFVDCEGIGVRG